MAKTKVRTVRNISRSCKVLAGAGDTTSSGKYADRPEVAVHVPVSLRNTVSDASGDITRVIKDPQPDHQTT